MSLRFRRKKEHLLLALQGSRCSFLNYYDDIVLLHNCLTEVNPLEVDLSSELCGYSTPAPLYINAITGGALVSEHINRSLAEVAARLKLPMAVGSQRAALKKRSLRFTYQVARRHNPQGLILANLSAHTCVRQAREAVEMLDAQILQLHLNPAQEFIMPEGDEIPPGLVDNIAAICAALPVPVLVKEVGFGMSSAQARTLFQAGVKAVDVCGVGGTNFALIEGRRNQSSWWKPFASWGLPTPLCVADVSRHVPELQVIASGGVDDGLKALKCLALGASNVAVAGGLLSALHRGGPRGAERHLRTLLRQIRVGAALLGVSKISQIQSVPLLIAGDFARLLQGRGIDPISFARRGC
jgi:isopentenyl-diphosphate delta-isomerase